PTMTTSYSMLSRCTGSASAIAQKLTFIPVNPLWDGRIRRSTAPNIASMPSPEDTLSTLNWLVETGADEAIVDARVDRFVGRTPATPPLEGAAQPISGRGPSPSRTSPKMSSTFSTLPQGEGKKPLANITPANTGPLGTDGYGSAVELAAMCQSLPQ